MKKTFLAAVLGITVIYNPGNQTGFVMTSNYEHDALVICRHEENSCRWITKNVSFHTTYTYAIQILLEANKGQLPTPQAMIVPYQGR
jgi:hypothetical protein